MPYGTDLSKLKAGFTTNAVSVTVGSVEQVSGVTENDFRNPVTYRLQSGLNYNDWTVNVTAATPGGKDESLKFTSFTIPGEGGMVGTDGNTMYIAVKAGTSLSALVPTFTTNADKVTVGSAEQTSGETANNFSNDVLYRLETATGYNEITVKTFQFGLPALFVNTPVATSSITKDDWVGGTTAVIFDSATGEVDLLGAKDDAEDKAVNQFKGRGNSTWGYAKKPYTIKLDKKESILGMPKDKRWNLLANWMDRTDMRNDIAFQLARVSPGLDWTPRGKHVELVLNWKHNGNYYLCEHIKIAEDRVNITAYDEKKPAPANEIGYLFELDTYFDEANKFRSSYMYKDSELADDSKIHAGPCWDYDYDTFTPGRSKSWVIKEGIWYKYLFKDPAFKARLKEKWNAQKSDYSAIASTYIDQLASQISSSVAVDKKMWPLSAHEAGKVNGDQNMSFDDAVKRMKTSLKTKIDFMNTAINNM